MFIHLLYCRWGRGKGEKVQASARNSRMGGGEIKAVLGTWILSPEERETSISLRGRQKRKEAKIEMIVLNCEEREGILPNKKEKGYRGRLVKTSIGVHGVSSLTHIPRKGKSLLLS